MIDELWRQRLFDAIDDDPRSERAISIAAGLGVNYVGQMRKRGKMPGVDAVMKICNALNVNAIFLFTGMCISAEDEQFLKDLKKLPPVQRKVFLDLLHIQVGSARLIPLSQVLLA